MKRKNGYSTPGLRIAIDGRAASGKTTVARQLAKKLGIAFFDTGVMYRAVAWLALHQGIDPADIHSLEQLAREFPLRMEVEADKTEVYRGDVKITKELYRPEISRIVAQIASVPGVRSELVRRQREYAKRMDMVIVGRDIATVVVPDAELKVFLTASLEVRAKRRWEELGGKQSGRSLQQVQDDLRYRDGMDEEREYSPLMAAPDAYVIDTSELSVSQVVERIIAYLKKADRSA